MRSRVAVGVLLALAVWAWWCTVSSTADARIAALLTVEPYAFAVHEQLARNFALHGRFFQTIHQGYEDSWAWSGHRAVTLILSSWLYGLAPSPHWLARIQILGVLLGAVPAALIGRRALGGHWGLLLGGLVYLSAPAVAALALQDYQDLVFGLPCLVFAMWAARTGRWWMVALGTAVAVLPREECIPLAAAVAVLAPPPRRLRLQGLAERDWLAWLAHALLACALAGAWAWWLASRYPVDQGHDVPMASTVGDLLGAHGAVFLDGWPYWGRFYALLLVPLGFLGLLAPETLLPAALLVLVHMTVPDGHGVDRYWGGHAHHLAPAAAFTVVATIEGAGRLLRRVRPRTAWGLVALMAVVAVVRDAAWVKDYNLVATLVPRQPEWWHPAWKLMTQVPEDAVPVVPKLAALVASSRSVAYTYDDSLADKARDVGLGAGTVMIVDTRQAGVLERALAMAGAEVVVSEGPYTLLRWTNGARDPTWASARGERLPRPSPWLGPYARRQDVPGVPPFLQRIGGATVLVLRLPWASEASPPRVTPRDAPGGQ